MTCYINIELQLVSALRGYDLDRERNLRVSVCFALTACLCKECFIIYFMKTVLGICSSWQLKARFQLT